MKNILTTNQNLRILKNYKEAHINLRSKPILKNKTRHLELITLRTHIRIIDLMNLKTINVLTLQPYNYYQKENGLKTADRSKL